MEQSTKRVIEQILKDAREKAKSIVDDARQSAELMLTNREKLARVNAKKEAVFRTRALRKVESEAEIIRGRVFTDAKRKASWMILAEKERSINDVLEEVKKRLIVLATSEKYMTFLENLLVEAGTVLGGGDLQFFLNEHDSILTLNLTKLAQIIAENSGVKTQLMLSKKRIEALGGAEVKTVDGRIVVDNTFENILKRREQELKIKIAKILFQNNEETLATTS